MGQNKEEKCTSEVIIDNGCQEKDIMISELSKTISEQKIALAFCNEAEEEVLPAEPDFLVKTITLQRGETFTGDNGKLTIALFNSEANQDTKRFWVEFTLNGERYTQNVGESINFRHEDGNEYTLQVVDSEPPSFKIYSN